MTRALVLFDIDGTLMLTGGAGSRCLRRAGRAILGDRFQWCPIASGLLDPQIFAQLAEHNGIAQPASLHGPFREHYLRELEAELGRIGEDVVVLPGVREMLEALNGRDDLTLGLLSGNYRKAAQFKLAAAGLDWRHFPVTALAEDGRDRNELPAFAMRQYRDLHGQPIPPHRVVIVGDTPRDIACAQAHGCQIIAVATGHYSAEQLQAAGACHVLPDLAQPGTLARVLRCAGLSPDEPAMGERESPASR